MLTGAMMARVNLKVALLLLVVGAGFVSLSLWAKCGSNHDISNSPLLAAQVRI
jgi:hypothetical protein